MNAKSRLGKGLSALIQGAENSARLGGREAREVELTRIHFNPEQPRKRFEEEKLQELAASIREVGILQPVLLRRLEPEEAGAPEGNYGPDGPPYRVVAGERRIRAARMAGLEKVPAIVCSYAETEALRIALVENIQREDLGPVEEARAFRNLMTAYGATQEELAAMLGKSRSGVANSLRLLNLDEEIQRMLDVGEISRGHAKALLGAEDGAFRLRLAQLCRSRGLSVRECERRIRKEGTAAGRPVARKRARGQIGQESPAIRELRRRAEGLLGAPLSIDHDEKSGKGTIHIRYFSESDLERILEKLGIDPDLS